MTLKRVVVTGMGALTPIGNDLQTFWKNLTAGVSGAAPITHFDASQFRTQFACELKNFDPLDHLDRKEAKRMDPYTQYAMVCAAEAIRDAGMDLEKLDKDRIGVIWASGIGGLNTFQEEISKYATGDGRPRFNPFFIPKKIANIASGMISMEYKFRGINLATVTACASSTNALIDAFNYIRLGKANIIVSGGSEAAVTAAGIGGFNAMKALSERNDSPETASRPFDVDRDGFVLGEGAGCLILEDLDHAKARGAKIYAEVIGGGISADAYHLTGTHPEGEGAVLAMTAALDDAQITPADVDHINMHATSTPLGDVSEAKAIHRLFKHSLDKVNLSATKSMTGHLLGAAGAAESIAAVLSIVDGVIPPTINTKNIDPEMPEGLNYTLGKAVKRPVNIAMSNTFGFGGHNAITVFQKFED
ncbi:MAG: beta-ketoacyl-ACP synthase II [Calditrichia bacterium]|nr:beta-ketoacyl-ACP synthase II [Calditrichota bacterium]MCB9068139.1 beta-ketoacyl-ACP synthase II [Calditrichia bacterium]